MKITLITLLFLLISVSLLADEPTIKEKMDMAGKDWENFKFEFYISPVVVADVGIGLSQRLKLKNVYQEGTLILHADLIPHVFFTTETKDFYKINLWGAKFKSAYFTKADYSGFNWFFNVGFEAIYIDLPLDPGGNSGISDPDWLVFPDLAIGCGYSWKLNNGHYFRLSADAGLKILISNIYISYVW